MSLHFQYLADRPAAIPLVAGWWFEAWGPPVPGATVESFTTQLRADVSRDRLPIQVVAVSQEAVVGVAVLKPQEMKELYPDKKNWLGSVYVAPKARGRGIASALANKIVELARAQGIGTLHLQTERLDGGLYAKLGWEKFDQVHYRGLEVLVMAKRLGDP